MPPKLKTLTSTTKCIKFGEILIDENKKVVLLCINCFHDFYVLQEFCKHLKNCKAAETVFHAAKFDCNTGNLLKKVKQKTRELLIYGINKKPEKPADNIISDIEAEVLNPRWYTDAAAPETKALNKNTATYNNLIEEVTPFVHFKENVRSLSTPKQGPATKQNAVRVEPPKMTAIKNEATDATKNKAINQINKKPIPQISTSPSKPTCARNLVYAQTTNTVSSTLKRKATTAEVVSPPAVTANARLNTNANKRARTATEPLPTPAVKQQRPPQRVASPPKKFHNSTAITAPTQPLTSQIRPQTVVNNQRPVAVPIQRPLTNVKLQLIKQTSQKLPTVSAITTAAEVRTSNSTTTPIKQQQYNNKTVDILHKLQNLGLKVQRTNPAPTQVAVLNEKDKAALEIIRKLQSKGMEIKRVPKANPNSAGSFQAPAIDTNVKYISPKTTTVVFGTPPKQLLLRKCN